jgi:hypothetical protein
MSPSLLGACEPLTHDLPVLSARAPPLQQRWFQDRTRRTHTCRPPVVHATRDSNLSRKVTHACVWPLNHTTWCLQSHIPPLQPPLPILPPTSQPLNSTSPSPELIHHSAGPAPHAARRGPAHDEDGLHAAAAGGQAQPLASNGTRPDHVCAAGHTRLAAARLHCMQLCVVCPDYFGCLMMLHSSSSSHGAARSPPWCAHLRPCVCHAGAAACVPQATCWAAAAEQAPTRCACQPPGAANGLTGSANRWLVVAGKQGCAWCASCPQCRAAPRLTDAAPWRSPPPHTHTHSRAAQARTAARQPRAQHASAGAREPAWRRGRA